MDLILRVLVALVQEVHPPDLHSTVVLDLKPDRLQVQAVALVAALAVVVLEAMPLAVVARQVEV